MKITKALETWGYKKRKNQRILKQICETHPEICISVSPIKAESKTIKPYLPDMRTKDIYVHIVWAVQNNMHLYPDILGLTEDKRIVLLRQLCSAGIIEKSGAWFAYNGEKLGQGKENVKLLLKENVALRDELEQKIREFYGIAK